jgi:hypothetical protein
MSRITVGDITEIREGDKVYIFSNYHGSGEGVPLKLRGTVVTYPIEELYNSNNNSNNNNSVNSYNEYTMALIGIDEIVINDTDYTYELDRVYTFGIDVIRLNDQDWRTFIPSDVQDVIDYEEQMKAKHEGYANANANANANYLANDPSSNNSTYNNSRNNNPVSIQQNGGKKKRTTRKRKATRRKRKNHHSRHYRRQQKQ